MDKVSAAKVFIDVAHCKSFTATAARLKMSRSMVTRYIETLETWLGVRLLHRTTRNVSLTTAGESCLSDLEQWVETAQLIENRVKPQGELVGTICIAASMSFGHAQLMSAVTEFMSQHPKVSIDVDLNDTAADLITSRIDLAIRIAALPDPMLIGKPIARCDSVLVASPDYLITHPTITSPEDLQQQHCLGYKSMSHHVWHLTQKEAHEAIEVKCRLTANEATALMQAAVFSAGIAMLPTYLVNPLLASGKLKLVLPDWTPQAMDIFVLYSSRKHLSPIVRSLIDFLSHYFKKAPWE